MSLPQRGITSTPDLCSESQVPDELTWEDQYPDETRSEIHYPTSVKSTYMFGSFHSPSNEQPNVMPVSGAESKITIYSNRGCLDDSVSKFPLDSICSIRSDELFGSFHSPSEEQLNVISVLGAEGQTTSIDNHDKMLLPVAEDTVCILDESCQHANVPLSEKLRPQGFDGGMGDHADSNPDNTFEGTNFPGIINLSGSFISQSPKSVGQGTDYFLFKPASAASARAKMEYTGENKILTKYQDPYPDNNSTMMKTTTVRKGPILLKRNSQSSEVDLSVKEGNFNESIVYQNQSGLGPVYSKEQVGSDDDEEGQTHAGQGQMYPSPDNLDLDYTITSFERPLSPGVNAPLHSGTLLLDVKAEATNIEVSQPNTMMPSHKMSILEEKLIIGEYSPSNVLPQPSPAMPSQYMSVPIPDTKMPQPHTQIPLQIPTLPKSNIDTEFPIKGMAQVITGVRLQPVSTTSSEPASPPPQLSLMDSITPSRLPVGSHPPEEVFSVLEMPKNITGHRLSALGTGQLEEDGDYVKMSGKPQSYSNTGNFQVVKTTDGHERLTVEQGPKMKNIEDSDIKEDRVQFQVFSILTEEKVQYQKDSVKNNDHTDRKNLPESQIISHGSRLFAKEGFKSDKEASSDVQVDAIEIDLKTSSHKTVGRLLLKDDAKMIVSSNSETYATIKETNDSVYREKRHDCNPLRPRPMISAEFPLPPPPEVQTKPFSEGDVDNQGKTGQPYGKKELFSKLHHETEDAVSKLKLPDSVELKDLNPLVIRFLVKNEKHRQVFEKDLSDIYGVAKWPSSLDDYVIIRCNVKVEDKNASSLLKDWSIRVVDKVDNIASGIEVAEFNMIQVAWPRVLKELEKIRVDNPEDVGVFIEQDKCSITLAGSRGTLEKLKKSVSDMIAMVITQIKHEKQRVTETKQMKTYAILLLGESDFKQEIKKMYPGLQFDLNQKEKNVIFVGQADIVQKAVVQMHEKLQSYVSRSMQISKPARDLLFAKEITEYIKQKMKSQKIFGVWDVVCKEEVRMFALDEEEVKKAIQLVSDCLVEKEILLDDAMTENVKGQQWLQLVERIQEKHKQKVAIGTSMNSILVVAKDDIFQDVFNKIKDYLEEHSVKEFVLALNLAKMKFIKRYKMEDIKALEKTFESLHVKLLIIDYGDQQGIKINGTNDGCKALQTALAEMAKNIITKEHAMVIRVGLKELFQCSRGQDELRLIELRWKCLIEMKDSSTSVSMQLEGSSGGYSSGSEDDADKSNEPSDRQSSSDSSGTSIDACGIKVSFVQGELALQRVDVIVNSTNEQLNLRIGVISKSIIEYGGDTIQRECLQHYPNGISPGQVVVTGGGNLSCMNVYHGCLRAYDGGKGKSLKLMKTFVKNCLKQANKTGFQSMAFPALGTGYLRFPADEVGKLILQCIQNFGKKTPKTSLKEIALVVFPEDINNIKAFTDLFGGATVPSASKIRSATLSSNISMDHGICKCTFPHSVVLEMIEGDITKEMTDVVVNSVLSDLNLNQGNVSKAILKTGGISIQQECSGKVPDLKKDGFVVTKAGNLLCKMIIHIAAQNKRKEWEDMIGKVLHHADQLKCESISFPALGTGGKGLSPKKIAQAIYSACTDFTSSQPVYLKKIRVVVFKKTMFTAFVQAIKDYSPGQRESRLSRFPVAGTLFKERNRQTNLVFCITIDSESNFKAAVRDLDGFIKNELTEKEINSPGEIISKLLDAQVTQIEGMRQGKTVVSINRKKGVIKVSGTHRDVLDTYDNITKYLHNIERETKAKWSYFKSFVSSAEQVPVLEV